MVLGCLSSEDRCCKVPTVCHQELDDHHVKTYLLQVIDPPNAFPDYSVQTANKISEIRERLEADYVRYVMLPTLDLKATEDDLEESLQDFQTKVEELNIDTIVFDISAFPKRYFCFLLLRLLESPFPTNLIVTYTQADSYLREPQHLASDLDPCSNLPGFADPLVRPDRTIVISIGFEQLNLAALIDSFAEDVRRTKILLSFPPDGIFSRRQWAVIRHIMGDSNISHMTEIVPALDVERVCTRLYNWLDESSGLIFAPFGPKPHTLAFALCAIQHDFGLYYTQPKAYHPDYSSGMGPSWAYVVKWDGYPCYFRNVYSV